MRPLGAHLGTGFSSFVSSLLVGRSADPVEQWRPRHLCRPSCGNQTVLAFDPGALLICPPSRWQTATAGQAWQVTLVSTVSQCGKGRWPRPFQTPVVDSTQENLPVHRCVQTAYVIPHERGVCVSVCVCTRAQHLCLFSSEAPMWTWDTLSQGICKCMRVNIREISHGTR